MKNLVVAVAFVAPTFAACAGREPIGASGGAGTTMPDDLDPTGAAGTSAAMGAAGTSAATGVAGTFGPTTPKPPVPGGTGGAVDDPRILTINNGGVETYKYRRVP